jgi:hypothetical protein
MAVFWVVAPCRLVWVYQSFRGLYCLHHQRDHCFVAEDDCLLGFLIFIIIVTFPYTFYYFHKCSLCWTTCFERSGHYQVHSHCTQATAYLRCIVRTTWFNNKRRLSKKLKVCGKVTMIIKTRIRLEVLQTLSTKMAVFWVVAPCRLARVYQRFRGPAASIIRAMSTRADKNTYATHGNATLQFSGMLHSVVWYKFIDVSEAPAPSIVRAGAVTNWNFTFVLPFSFILFHDILSNAWAIERRIVSSLIMNDVLGRKSSWTTLKYHLAFVCRH